MIRKAQLSLIISLTVFFARSEVRLAPVFSDHMVIQRDKPWKLWGTCSNYEKITVTLGKFSKTWIAGSSGRWVCNLPPMPAGGPHSLLVKSTKTITVSDILFGDVWLAAGQSNMAFEMYRSKDFDLLKLSLTTTGVRMLTIKQVATSTPIDTVQIESPWTLADTFNIKKFSAVAYYTAFHTFLETGIPQGIIHSSWGGSFIENWIPESQLTNFSELINENVRLRTTIKDLTPTQYRDEKMPAWKAVLQNQDQGYQQNWHKPTTNIALWNTMHLPTAWERQGLDNIDGIVYFKKHITITGVNPHSKSTLNLGLIDDKDEVYVNGNYIGGMESFTRNRTYIFSNTYLKDGINEICVKVSDWGGKGGIVSGQLYLYTGGNKIALSGDWKYNIAVTQTALSDYIHPKYSYRHDWTPSSIYNGMIHGLRQIPIYGWIWYQGESDADNLETASRYYSLLKSLKQGFEATFGPDIKAVIIQLPDFNQPMVASGYSGWSELRLSQAKFQQEERTISINTLGCGDAEDIHPSDKQCIGLRAAHGILHAFYHKKNFIAPPMYKSHKLQSNLLKLMFSNEKLAISNGYSIPNGIFEAILDNGKIIPLQYTIAKNEVLLFLPENVHIQKIRYGMVDHSNFSYLVDAHSGIPVSPFEITIH